MVFDLIHNMTAWLVSMIDNFDTLSTLLEKLPLDGSIVAQSVSDTNLFGQVQSAWIDFVKTGKIWAFGVGVIVGWVLKNILP